MNKGGKGEEIGKQNQREESGGRIKINSFVPTQRRQPTEGLHKLFAYRS